MKNTFVLLMFMQLILLHCFSQTILKNSLNSRNEYRDQYGRVIWNSQNQKLNYSQDQTPEDERESTILPDSKASSDLPTSGTLAEPIWKFTIMGTSIGRKSIYCGDLDGDGKNEILCSANMGYSSTYTSVWYTLEYDALTQKYNHDFVSTPFFEQITRIKILDLNNDGIKEIVIGSSAGKISIYNSVNKAFIGTFNIPGAPSLSASINDIEFGDANNDNINELVISTDNNIYLFNATNYTSKGLINQGAEEFCLGNVDNNNDIEIITTFGKVLKYSNGNLETKWSFYSGQSSDWGYMIEISDIDADGMSEIVCAKSWAYIDVFDADTKSLKFQIPSELDIQALLLADVNNDHIDEIFYGDGQWGKIYCHNSTNGSLKWSIANPEHGVTGLSLSDVDNDGTLEIMWGAGWTSTGSDYLYVASTDTHSIEWQSKDIDGPFYAVKAGDIDNDGQKEVVAVSYESESGYESGVISVFDGLTHLLEWQSTGNFMYDIWTGVWDVELENIDSDPQMEIIVAADDTYDGAIWVIDGLTKAKQNSVIFPYSSNISEFRAVEVEDITGDSKKEILAVTGDHYYYINPDDFSILYTSGSLYYEPIHAKIANINSSSEKELILISGGRLMVQGCTSHSQLFNQSNGYTAVTTYDINGDYIDEIIAGNSSGQIVVLDGTSYQIVKQFTIANQKIDGIELANLGNSALPEYIFTSGGKLYIYNDNEKTTVTDKLAEITGAYNSIVVDDINNDGQKEILVGNSFQVLEFGSEIYKCGWLTLSKTIQNVSCSSNADGSVLANASGTIGPYQYNWNNGSTGQSISNLTAGTYIVTIHDAIGCAIIDTSLVAQSAIAATYAKTNEFCNPENNGTATVTINQGTPPYTYSWNNGQTTSSINNLKSGTYSVIVKDSKNCSLTHNFQIDKDVLNFSLSGQNVSCFGLNNGSVTPVIIIGNPPYSYSWSNSQTGNRLYNVSAGNYSVTITDSHGCVQLKSLEITQPPAMLLGLTTILDDSSTPFGDGSATINVIGGTPPYSVKWNDPFLQNTITAINLLAGPYQVTVTDSKNCSKSLGFYLAGTNGIEETEVITLYSVFPNPTNTGKVNIKIVDTENHILSLTLINTEGKIVEYIPPANVSPDQLTELNTKNLSAGLYYLRLFIDGKPYSSKIQVLR